MVYLDARADNVNLNTQRMLMYITLSCASYIWIFFFKEQLDFSLSCEINAFENADTKLFHRPNTFLRLISSVLIAFVVYSWQFSDDPTIANCYSKA